MPLAPADVYDDLELTGGLPPVPANATAEGVVDLSSLKPGTIVTVLTKSMSKWTLTVQEDGTANVDRHVWYAGEFLSCQWLHEQYKEAGDFEKTLQEQYPHLEFTVRPKHQAFRDKIRNYVDLPPIFGLGHFPIEPFRAGERLCWNSKEWSGAILFWSIDE